MIAKKELIKKMTVLRLDMLILSKDMGKFCGEIAEHAEELKGAAGIMQTWIDGIKDES